MSRQITEHFNEDELKCSCGCGRMLFSDKAIQKLEDLRMALNAPIRINSGYRCPLHNERVSRTGLNGPHTVFEDDNITVDIKVSGVEAHNLLLAIDFVVFSGIGIKQTGSHSIRFIHLDCIESGSRPWVWSY
jgi:zinc D-Ala-D-Ala carboxypeptidase